MKSIISPRRSYTGYITVALRAAPLAFALACDPSPTTPELRTLSPRQSASVSFDPSVIDSPVQGSDAQLTGFDGASLLSYVTTKGSFTAVFDNATVFRAANLNQFAPVDPCRDYAVNYNTAGTAGDASGLFAAISAMSTGGCLARIHVDRIAPNPPPIKSFRPLAGF
jgi:hypothetical protein